MNDFDSNWCNNRTLTKVQSALLEAIQEKTVTIGETSFKLDTRLLVLATQNPVDQEGTYSLPKAQIDRLMLKVKIDYPSKEEELEVMRRMSNMAFKPELKTLLTKEDIFSIRNEENQVSISRSLKKYSIELVYATRNAKALGLDKETYYMQFGASPRASINLN